MKGRVLKILLLAPHGFYIDRGTPIDVDLVLRALSERGMEVDAVVFHEGQDRDYRGLTLHRITPPKFLRRWLRGIGPGFSARKLVCDVMLFLLAWRLVRTRKYDVVHAGEEAVFLAMLFKAMYGVPYVYDMDSSIAQQLVEKMSWLWPLSWWFNFCEGAAVRGSLAAAPVCNALADLARGHGAPHLVTLHDISQLDNPDRQPTGQLRGKLGLRPGVPMLMYVGNLEAYQGVDLLMAAFAVALKRGVDVDLVIAGGSDRGIKRYQTKAQRLEIAARTHLIGRWPVDRLEELLAEADILTAPRILGVNTPMKIFPYLHSGTPVLVTDLPTHSQILNQEVAVLAPAEPEGFADAIGRLAQDAELRRRIGRAGRAFVEMNHTYEAHRRRVNALYDYVAARCR
jgi:glycosyltransferase involved in cell wall biosynthesis